MALVVMADVNCDPLQGASLAVVGVSDVGEVEVGVELGRSEGWPAAVVEVSCRVPRPVARTTVAGLTMGAVVVGLERPAKCGEGVASGREPGGLEGAHPPARATSKPRPIVLATRATGCFPTRRRLGSLRSIVSLAPLRAARNHPPASIVEHCACSSNVVMNLA